MDQQMGLPDYKVRQPPNLYNAPLDIAQIASESLAREALQLLAARCYSACFDRGDDLTFVATCPSCGKGRNHFRATIEASRKYPGRWRIYVSCWHCNGAFGKAGRILTDGEPAAVPDDDTPTPTNGTSHGRPAWCWSQPPTHTFIYEEWAHGPAIRKRRWKIADQESHTETVYWLRGDWRYRSATTKLTNYEVFLLFETGLQRDKWERVETWLPCPYAWRYWRDVPLVGDGAGDQTKSLLFITEGERDCETLWALGLPATTVGSASARWHPEQVELLRGRVACVVPDNDEPGLDAAQRTVSTLSRAGIETYQLVLPGPVTPTHGFDVSDYVEQGATKESLLELVIAAMRH